MNPWTQIPHHPSNYTIFMFVTVEQKDLPIQIRRWRGRSANSIRKAAKQAYPGATLTFGEAYWVAN